MHQQQLYNQHKNRAQIHRNEATGIVGIINVIIVTDIIVLIKVKIKVNHHLKSIIEAEDIDDTEKDDMIVMKIVVRNLTTDGEITLINTSMNCLFFF